MTRSPRSVGSAGNFSPSGITPKHTTSRIAESGRRCAGSPEVNCRAPGTYDCTPNTRNRLTLNPPADSATNTNCEQASREIDFERLGIPILLVGLLLALRSYELFGIGVCALRVPGLAGDFRSRGQPRSRGRTVAPAAVHGPSDGQLELSAGVSSSVTRWTAKSARGIPGNWGLRQALAAMASPAGRAAGRPPRRLWHVPASCRAGPG
jgi:hypothetical protein